MIFGIFNSHGSPDLHNVKLDGLPSDQIARCPPTQPNSHGHTAKSASLSSAYIQTHAMQCPLQPAAAPPLLTWISGSTSRVNRSRSGSHNAAALTSSPSDCHDAFRGRDRMWCMVPPPLCTHHTLWGHGIIKFFKEESSGRSKVGPSDLPVCGASLSLFKEGGSVNRKVQYW